MSFFNCQSKEEREYYLSMLNLMGMFSGLFSESKNPYIDSRVAENLFCMCLNADNLARKDCTADAKKGKLGIGIKTWVGSEMQKIAEFNSERPLYKNLKGIDLADKISELRNARILTTENTYSLTDGMIYHCILRNQGIITVNECNLTPVNRNKIRIISNSEKTLKFSDEINEYSFNYSKSVLYKRFNDLEIQAQCKVEILSDPYRILYEKMFGAEPASTVRLKQKETHENQIYLKLYRYTGSGDDKQKEVHEKSGLNQWNAKGRPRDPNEIYIPISRKDHEKTPGFFPPRDSQFTLILPDGNEIKAKVCQDNDKALMSNPNSALGKWLLRKVLGLKPRELLTYNMLLARGIDSVVVTKLSDKKYKIDFAATGSYEAFMNDDWDTINELSD